jgi:hypothetical protein
MNEKDCIDGEYYWVSIVGYYIRGSEYEVVRYKYKERGERWWERCGSDESIDYYPDYRPDLDDRHFLTREWISKIISHIERPKDD